MIENKKMKLSFIQMSDIHFRSHSGDPYDIDNPIRKAAINDLNMAKQQLGMFDGLLICGDIAFSGQEEEYKVALEFIDEVRGQIEIPEAKVFCVAGNHDVDQSLIKKSPSIQDAQNRLIEKDRSNWEETDGVLRDIQNDALGKGILYKPLTEYNNAFGKMASNYTVERPNWSHSIEMAEGKSLVLHGMNSVLVSSHLDHKIKDTVRKMVINYRQVPAPTVDDTVYLSMCHHPPELWENAELIEYMDEIVKIQLYGHIHMQAVDANLQRIRIYSGALQPDRGTDWKPQYNWIQIYVDRDILSVDIYPRVFDKTKFIPERDECDKGEIFRHCELRLGNNVEETDERKEEVKNTEMSSGIRMTNDAIREIVLRLYQLSPMEEKKIRKRYMDREFDFSPEGIDDTVDWLYDNHMESDFLDFVRGL